ncbi:MAG: ABC transporter permease, partial [Anaerolineales bacterium]
LLADLVLEWTRRTIRARYQQSLLGWLWAIVQPVASVAMFTVIFTLFIPIDTGGIPYPVFSYVGIIVWTLLASALTDMTDSLVQNMTLITKIFFPRSALPAAAMLARVVDFAIGSLLLGLLMIGFNLPVNPAAMLFLPLIFATQIALILGIGLGAAALNVFFRDVQPVMKLGLQLWFYASPIIYPVTAVPDSLKRFYYLNPMAGLIESYRDVLIEGVRPGQYLQISAATSLVILAIGYFVFRRLEPRFADII